MEKYLKIFVMKFTYIKELIHKTHLLLFILYFFNKKMFE